MLQKVKSVAFSSFPVILFYYYWEIWSFWPPTVRFSLWTSSFTDQSFCQLTTTVNNSQIFDKKKRSLWFSPWNSIILLTHRKSYHLSSLEHDLMVFRCVLPSDAMGSTVQEREAWQHVYSQCFSLSQAFLLCVCTQHKTIPAPWGFCITQTQLFCKQILTYEFYLEPSLSILGAVEFGMQTPCIKGSHLADSCWTGISPLTEERDRADRQLVSPVARVKSQVSAVCLLSTAGHWIIQVYSYAWTASKALVGETWSTFLWLTWCSLITSFKILTT